MDLNFDDMTHSAPLFFAAIVVGAAISNFLGGVISDWAERASPNYGRGAKEPMMQAVVLPELRSSAYSVTSVIEGGLSALAGLIAGALADRYGFTTAIV